MEVACTLAQINPTTADIEGNTASIIDALDRAAAAGADVVAFPELAITGYCILDLVEDDAFVAANRRALEHVRDHTGETAAVVGFVDRDRQGRYNAAAVLQNGEIKGVARKVLLPNYRYFDDERYFESGGPVAPIPVEVGGRTVELGVAVCEDMWDGGYGRKPIPELARQGADLIVSVNASPFQTGKRRLRHETIRRHVADMGLPFLYVNTVGAADVGRNVVVFDGESLAYAPDGTLRATGERFVEDRVPVAVGRPDAPTDDPPPAFPDERREKELYEALFTALRDYAAKTGFERVIAPVAGDADSALGLAICADALGPENVLAYHLPSTDAETSDVAVELAENFGVEWRVLPIRSIYDEVVATWRERVGAIETPAAEAAIRARIRGLLVTLASNESPAGAPALPISTRNETELALGARSEAMAGALDVLGDLSKNDVDAVARYVNERYGEEVIPPAAFERRSADRRPGRDVPFDDRTAAPIVDDLLEGRSSPSGIVARFERGELDPERYGVDDRGRSIYERYDADAFAAGVYDVYRRLTASTLERARAPPVVAVSERAFGTDFREPIINGWDGRLPEWT